MPDSARKYDVREKVSGALTGPAKHAADYASHYQDREWAKLNADITTRRRAQWWGGAICLVALGGTIITALAGAHPTVSVALAGIPVLASIRAVLGTPRV